MPSLTFNVQMACGGCSSAVTRIMKKKDYVDEDSIKIDMDAQTATVTVSEEGKGPELLEALKKWATAANKTVSLVE